MKNGGVAILGSAAAAGENRAQTAIEEALNSPLLNDSDIRGAKWILININSAEGEHEFTMDEVEIIQNYLLSQAGDTDVILGLGYDNTLGNKIGITLIATGFEHKDPFTKTEPRKKEVKEDKIVMVLGEEEKPSAKEPVQEIKPEAKVVDIMAPRLVDNIPAADEPVSAMMIVEDEELEEQENESYILQPADDDTVVVWDLYVNEKPLSETTNRITGETTGDKMKPTEKKEQLYSKQQSDNLSVKKEEEKKVIKDNSTPVSAASGGYLARPSNIYAETQAQVSTSLPSAEEPVSQKPPHVNEEPPCDMQLVMRDDIPAADMPLAHHSQQPLTASVEEPPLADEGEEQQRRAAERLKKLRNLSFNINAADPNNEFETVPAYIRRNMELYGSNPSVENFYSNYEVKTDENNQTKISTINTFLDGKKPD
jgi:cell division protein FtsZ